jgi:drug/metabolite transporter (DMT)-like permease
VKDARFDARVPAALAVTTILWASAFAGIRVGLEAYGLGLVALMRFLVASTVLAAYAAITRMRLPERRDLPAVFPAVFLAFTVYHVAPNYGEVTVSAGAASILINTAPLLTALPAVTFLGERLRALGWVGMAVSFLGAALTRSEKARASAWTREPSWSCWPRSPRASTLCSRNPTSRSTERWLLPPTPYGPAHS